MWVKTYGGALSGPTVNSGEAHLLIESVGCGDRGRIHQSRVGVSGPNR